jgi:hypothetical protein
MTSPLAHEFFLVNAVLPMVPPSGEASRWLEDVM